MRMRARRMFVISGWDRALEVRLSPSIVSPYVVVGTPPAGPTISWAPDAPSPGPNPTIAQPELPPTGPVGPGTS